MRKNQSVSIPTNKLEVQVRILPDTPAAGPVYFTGVLECSTVSQVKRDSRGIFRVATYFLKQRKRVPNAMA